MYSMEEQAQRPQFISCVQFYSVIVSMAEALRHSLVLISDSGPRWDVAAGVNQLGPEHGWLSKGFNMKIVDPCKTP